MIVGALLIVLGVGLLINETRNEAFQFPGSFAIAFLTLGPAILLSSFFFRKKLHQ